MQQARHADRARQFMPRVTSAGPKRQWPSVFVTRGTTAARARSGAAPVRLQPIALRRTPVQQQASDLGAVLSARFAPVSAIALAGPTVAGQLDELA